MLIRLIKTLLALYGGLSPTNLYPSDDSTTLQNGDVFDFIIVGAGSAGAVLANRLSEIPQWKILLVEAGGYPSDMSEIPAVFMSLQGSEVDWQYAIGPSDTSCLGLRDQVCPAPRGKGLGGSTIINFMMYTRATRYDHDRWVESGNVGWDYETALKYYAKFENAHVEDNVPYGTTGELDLTRYTSTHPVRQTLAKAYEELGYQRYSDAEHVGYRDLMLTIYQGARQNVAKAFLIPAQSRTNLRVSLNTHATKVLIDPKTLTALGVEVKIGEQTLQLRSNNEVILSAGAYSSPQILMRSGVGPKEHLDAIGIDVVKDLRVGDNLQDHLALPTFLVGLDNSAVEPLTTYQILNELYRYFANRDGKLAGIELVNFASYINTVQRDNDADIHVAHGVFQQQDPYVLDEYLKVIGLRDDVAETVRNNTKHQATLVLLPILLRPKSLGRLRLRDADPASKPLIQPNFLNDPNGDDLETLLESVKALTRLTQTEAFKAHVPRILDFNITNCQGFEPQSDDFWRCAVRNTATPMYHPTGTCKMGVADDAVVDPRLRVYGIDRLRVVDASVMPVIVSCNTNAPTIMIGEKGADLIKEDWGVVVKVAHEEL